mmetsp:Transcript_435/g.1211  ORF Transcript_435/g.1211 Transcript_435/m.1211 type:complete len:218 (-) Transcript_435:308-961(-)|eukprot:CAMPEP_0198122192 /NCGR_PEP_ID=MMETSP1442-20131203/34138_1 /TAXON_ID= /ORGANISM="Craspedostauros australis, Strain CCMP3328" /LENGTH=217 /DNA_ID=CAMNT_0043781159 /DNA_START=224 /DNA_END=877 /DNA_ORIENTATION=+
MVNIIRKTLRKYSPTRNQPRNNHKADVGYDDEHADESSLGDCDFIPSEIIIDTSQDDASLDESTMSINEKPNRGRSRREATNEENGMCMRRINPLLRRKVRSLSPKRNRQQQQQNMQQMHASHIIEFSPHLTAPYESKDLGDSERTHPTCTSSHSSAWKQVLQPASAVVERLWRKKEIHEDEHYCRKSELDLYASIGQKLANNGFQPDFDVSLEFQR